MLLAARTDLPRPLLIEFLVVEIQCLADRLRDIDIDSLDHLAMAGSLEAETAPELRRIGVS